MPSGRPTDRQVSSSSMHLYVLAQKSCALTRAFCQKRILIKSLTFFNLSFWSKLQKLQSEKSSIGKSALKSRMDSKVNRKQGTLQDRGVWTDLLSLIKMYSKSVMIEFAKLQQLLAKDFNSPQAFLRSQDINNIPLTQSYLQFRGDLCMRGTKQLERVYWKARGALRSEST